MASLVSTSHSKALQSVVRKKDTPDFPKVGSNSSGFAGIVSLQQ